MSVEALDDEMTKTDTWPVPPIILSDGALVPTAPHAKSGRGYLLEGHRRTAMLLKLAAQGRAGNSHQVWVARH